VNPIESNKQSSSAVASASASTAIPLPGDYARPGQIPNPGKYGPPPGVVPKPGTIAPPKVGTMVAPGFAPSGIERGSFSAEGSAARPTRIHRRVTDVDRRALHSRRGRSLV
jgi:hypothetical protein